MIAMLLAACLAPSQAANSTDGLDIDPGTHELTVGEDIVGYAKKCTSTQEEVFLLVEETHSEHWKTDVHPTVTPSWVGAPGTSVSWSRVSSDVPIERLRGRLEGRGAKSLRVLRGVPVPGVPAPTDQATDCRSEQRDFGVARPLMEACLYEHGGRVWSVGKTKTSDLGGQTDYPDSTLTAGQSIKTAVFLADPTNVYTFSSVSFSSRVVQANATVAPCP